MRILVTGSSGHLGEALCRVLAADGVETVGLDILPSPYTDVVGSVADRDIVARGARRRRRGPARGDAAQAARRLAHPPGVRRDQHHRHADAARGGGRGGRRPRRLHEHDERVRPRAGAGGGRARRTGSPRTSSPVPRNIYGVTKVAAENVCELVHRDHGLPILILRTSRFFPEADDRDEVRAAYEDANLKVNELLYRRADLEDVVERAPARARAGARARLRPLHHQRHDAVHARRPRRAARRRAERRRAPPPGLRRALRAARLADVRGDRARLRQRRRPPRPRLDAAPRLRATPSSASRAARSGAAS